MLVGPGFRKDCGHGGGARTQTDANGDVSHQPQGVLIQVSTENAPPLNLSVSYGHFSSPSTSPGGLWCRCPAQVFNAELELCSIRQEAKLGIYEPTVRSEHLMTTYGMRIWKLVATCA